MNMHTKLKVGNGILPLALGWKGAGAEMDIIGGPFDDFPGRATHFGVCVRAERVPNERDVHLPIHDFCVPDSEKQVEYALMDTFDAAIEGKQVYSRLKYESGVHRVQRVPVTEASGRVHTSTATVAVLPEAEEVDIQIEAKDLRIDTFCSSGPGGQSVNTTYSAVRITHIPTGIVVSQQDEKSQIKNRAKAMKVLRARLYEMEMQKQQDAIAKERRGQVGTGERSEKIRTYNFPDSRITDHRVNFKTGRVHEVLDGDLGQLIDEVISFYNTQKLKEVTTVEEPGPTKH